MRAAPIARGLLLVALVGACSGDSTTSAGSATATEATGSTSAIESTSSTSTSTSTTSDASTDATSSSDASTSAAETTGDGAHDQLWFAQVRGVGDQSIHSVAIAADGDVLIAGAFTGSIEAAGATLASLGGRDLFVARYAADGSPRWAIALGGAGQEHEATIVADVDGGALLSGEFSGSVELAGLDPLVSAGETDLLLVRIDALGAPTWARAFGGAGVELEPRARLDPAGDIVLTVVFDGELDLGGGVMTAIDAGDLAIARLTDTGEHVWSRSIGGVGDLSAHDLAIDESGDLAITGWFGAAVDFGGGPLEPGGAYVAVLDGDDGGHRWSRALGDGGNTGGCGVRFADDGGLLLTGWFQGSIDVGLGPIVAVDHSDYFVARYQVDGAAAWASGHGGPIVDSGCGIASAGGDWILGGYFTKQIDLGGGPLGDGSPCGFVAGLGADGAHHWSAPVCATSGGIVQRLAVDPGGHVVFVGDFAGPMNLFGAEVGADAFETFGLVAHVPIALVDP